MGDRLSIYLGGARGWNMGWFVMVGVVWVCKTHLGGVGKKNMSFRWELEGRFLEMLMYESYC